MVRSIVLLLAITTYTYTNSLIERTDLGICGGRANYYAWDDVHKVMFAGVEAAMNLFKSADSGKTWVLAYPSDSLQKGWSNDCRVIKSCNGLTIAVVGQKAIISDNGGETWRYLFNEQAIQTALNAAGMNGSIQSASSTILRYGKIYLSSGNLILCSSDTGKSWKATVFPDSTAKNVPQEQRKGVQDILPLNASGTHLLALASDQGSRDAKLYESKDGVIFTKKSFIDSSKLINPGDPAIEASVFTQLFSTDIRPEMVMALESQNINGNNRIRQIWKSIDTASTWTPICTNEKLPGTTYDIAQILAFEDSLFPQKVRLASGLNYSDDWGATWKHVDNSNGPSLHGFRCHVPGTSIYMAFNEDAPYRTKDSVVGSWEYSATGMTSVQVNQIAQDPANLDLVYLATNSGIAITTKYTDSSITNSQKWQKPYGVFPMQPFGGIPSVGTITISPYDNKVILAGGGNGILKTANGGFQKTDWHQDNFGTTDGHVISQVGGLDVNQFGAGGGVITSFAWYTKDTVFASFACGHSNYGGVLISTDGGDSFSVWQPLPIVACNVIKIYTDKTNGTKMIYAGYGNREQNTSVPCMLWSSPDGGTTWDSCMVTGGSTNQNTHNTIYDLACGVGTIDTIFIATEFGIAISTDTGKTASVITMPTPAREMCAVTVDNTTNTMSI